jgi:uncharacterized membrane protein
MKLGSRYESVDALRGLIMMIMAIDHASFFVARQHASEFWAGAMTSYSSAFPFLSRWITHLCAPGFFFLMGASIYWYAASRREAGTSESAVMRRTVWRGFAIFLTGQLLETPAVILQSLLKPAQIHLSQTSAPLPSDGSTLYWGWVVLSGLGLAMMVCGLLLLLRPWVWLLVSALCVIATNSFLPASGQPGSLPTLILLAPGVSHHLLIMYPLIPWLAVAAAGMYFGYWWRANPDRARQRVWVTGAVVLLIGVALRAAGGWGNIRPPRDAGWIEFLNNVKYPPSLVFWTISVGLNLLLLALLLRLPEKLRSERSPLIVFGQTPLFFYVAHFYLLALCAFSLFQEAASLETAYLVWALALVALYPACAWYRRFKLGRPRESLWHLF